MSSLPYWDQGHGDAFQQARRRAAQRENDLLAEIDQTMHECRLREERGRRAMADAMELDDEIARGMQGLNLGGWKSQVHDDKIARLEKQLEQQKNAREETTKVQLEQTLVQSHQVVDLSRNDQQDDDKEGEEEEEDSVFLVAQKQRIENIRAQLANFQLESKQWREKYRVSTANDAQGATLNFLPDFTDQEEDLYEWAMEGQGGDIELFERNNSKMYRSRIRSLLPGAWLNDEVINQYLSLLRTRSLDMVAQADASGAAPVFKCYFHLTHFYTKLLEPGKYDYSLVRRWTMRGSRKCDLFAMDRVFFPRNISNSHWTLAWADMKNRRIEYLDSMGGSGDKVMEDLLRYLSDEHQNKKKAPLDTSDWERVNRGSSVPQQNNCNDCGVFLSIFANYLSLGHDLNFSCKDMEYFRKRMAVDLMSGNAHVPQPV